jgi:hypothetical protein
MQDLALQMMKAPPHHHPSPPLEALSLQRGILCFMRGNMGRHAASQNTPLFECSGLNFYPILCRI